MKISLIKIAIDRSARHIDVDGRLHLDRSHISKATVNPYYGREIPRWVELGLQADKIYQLFRDPVELERAASSFERKPILKKHIDDPDVDAMPKELVIGTIGSNVKFTHPYLDADLCFWDATAIAGIETDTVRELSCGYRYTAVMGAGEFEGQPYDGKITEIIGNHLALVEVGRAGSDVVVVGDQNPFIAEEKNMKQTRLGKALMMALCALSPTLAADSAWNPLVAEATRKNFKKDEVKKALMAVDAAIDSSKIDSLLDAILEVEQDPVPAEPVATDESPAEQLRKLLEGKVDEDVMKACMALIPAEVAVNADPDEDDDKKDMVKKEDVKVAVDAMRKELMATNEAAEDVRPVVGKVMGIDSAEGIYSFALKHMKVDHEGVKGAPALKALFKVAHASSQNAAPAPTLATDAASVKEKFPNANRFTRG